MEDRGLVWACQVSLFTAKSPLREFKFSSFSSILLHPMNDCSYNEINHSFDWFHAVLHALVTRNGGTVEVKSAGRGRGCTFTMKYPVYIVQRGVDIADTDHSLSSSWRSLAQWGMRSLRIAPIAEILTVGATDAYGGEVAVAGGDHSSGREMGSPGLVMAASMPPPLSSRGHDLVHSLAGSLPPLVELSEHNESSVSSSSSGHLGPGLSRHSLSLGAGSVASGHSSECPGGDVNDVRDGTNVGDNQPLCALDILNRTFSSNLTSNGLTSKNTTQHRTGSFVSQSSRYGREFSLRLCPQSRVAKVCARHQRHCIGRGQCSRRRSRVSVALRLLPLLRLLVNHVIATQVPQEEWTWTE